MLKIVFKDLCFKCKVCYIKRKKKFNQTAPQSAEKYLTAAAIEEGKAYAL
jgi:hypothetical protein